MVEVRTYILPPTSHLPNSPWPLLYYPKFLFKENECTAANFYDIFTRNGWQVQWINRYGQTQRAHYHSATHECMAVLSGNATIRFGAADTSEDSDENTYGSGKEPGGVEVATEAGDVFVIPAGVSHKTYDTRPAASFETLTPGDGHRVASTDVRQSLADIELSGFTMIGAYPQRSSKWDFMVGGEVDVDYNNIWAVPRPDKDPVLGVDTNGVCGQWQSQRQSAPRER